MTKLSCRRGTCRRRFCIHAAPLPETDEYKKGQIWKLLRALYGLRWAPRLWQDFIAKLMMDIGAKRFCTDWSVYSYKGVYVLIHVDDILAVGQACEVRDLHSKLAETLNMKFDEPLRNEGDTGTMLGRKLTRTKTGYTMEGDRRTIDELVASIGLVAGTSSRTNAPGTPGEQIGKNME